MLSGKASKPMFELPWDVADETVMNSREVLKTVA
jgi:hypothetical protein